MTRIFTKGSGPPLVLIPRLEGRWEYLTEAVDSLARSFRVLTFSLAGEPSSGVMLDRSRGLDGFVSQVERVLDEQQVERAIVCGVSFGGVIAVRFAAAHPARTAGLVVASAPGPRWRLKPRHLLYARAPWLFGPIFVAETPFRLRAEIRAACPGVGARLRLAAKQFAVFRRAPVSLLRMAQRARIMSPLDATAECARITAPTLVITGEPRLDHIVPVDTSGGGDGTSDYARLIPGATHVVLARTGHQGVLTRPDAFADLIRSFVENQRHAAA